MKKIIIGILVGTIIFITPRAGDLDPTFGSGTGKVITPVAGGNAAINGIRFQPDGKFVVAGQAGGDFALARYHADGSIDTTFGTAGIVKTNFGGTDDVAYALLRKADGKLVAIGSTNDGTTTNVVALAQYNSDGSLDTTFNGTGMVTTNIANDDDQAFAAALQPDGKIVVAGRSPNLIVGDYLVLRYNIDGSLDTSFGTNGVVITNIAGNDLALAIALQSDGKIIVAGETNFRFSLARYLSNGQLDVAFGNNGTIETFFTGTNTIHGIALQPDHKIVVAGSSNTNVALARYNPNGTLDSTFGTGSPIPGVVRTNLSSDDAAFAIQIPSNGNIVIAGYTHNSGSNDFLIARYTTDGMLDHSFGGTPTAGTVRTSFSGSNDEAFALTFQPDGKMVAAGTSGNNFALARYLNDALFITKTASTTTAFPGQNITYTINVYNSGGGGGGVNGIEITDILPHNIIFRSATASTGTFDPLTSMWTIDSLAVGTKATLTIKGRIDQCAGNTLIKNTALTTYSYVDMVSDSSIIDVQNQVFSTIACVSTFATPYENLNKLTQRIDCDVDTIADNLNQFIAQTDTTLQTILNKLNCIAASISPDDCNT